MNRPMPLSTKFRHVVFPGQVVHRRGISIASPSLPPDPPSCATPVAGEAERFMKWLFSRAGLDAQMYRRETLDRRLPACLRAVGAGSMGEARGMLEQSQAMVQAALSALLVGVTSFFRDSSVFTVLRDEVLPALRRWKRAIHIWSAGCSEGAELYSVAILLDEAGLLEGSYLLGTDCRASAIERAKRGIFDVAGVKDVPPPLLARHFESVGGAFEVCRRLRGATRWQVANVLAGLQPGFWDIILFRNTAMYLRPEHGLPLLDKMELSLKPGGFLVLGKAERPLAAKRLSCLCPCIYRRVR